MGRVQIGMWVKFTCSAAMIGVVCGGDSMCVCDVREGIDRRGYNFDRIKFP